jgi:fibronectin type 3 domain-containing protein
MDSGLTSGTTYYYVVTAVDASGNESPFSTEASVVAH